MSISPRRPAYAGEPLPPRSPGIKQLGLLHWQRRSHAAEDGKGGFRLVQETNAYASLPPSQWRGYFEPPPPPPPEPGTWGDHPPLPPVIDQAAADLAAGSSHRTVLAGLECDPGDPLAGALASRPRPSRPANLGIYGSADTAKNP